MIRGMTLAEFLLARIGEDAEAARAAVAFPGAERWQYAEAHGSMEVRTVATIGTPGYAEPLRVTQDAEGLSDSVADWAGPHIARWDPARVLAECAAKRAILALHETHEPGPYAPHPFCDCQIEDGVIFDAEPCATKVALAAVYAAHPDYDQAWAPRG